MNKFFVLFAVVLLALTQDLPISETKQGWQIQIRQLNYPVTPRNFNGYDFNTNAVAIRYMIECNQPSDIVLLPSKF